MAKRLTCQHERTESHVHREGLKHHTYFKCLDCPAEWTITETVEDLAEPLTSSELIDVHELLKTDKTLGELIPKEKQP